MKGPRCPSCGLRFVTRGKRDQHRLGCKSKKYQLLICGHHSSDPTTDDTLLGFVICIHVREQGAMVASVASPTEHQVGEIVCSKEVHGVEELSVICSICARTNGFVAAA